MKKHFLITALVLLAIHSTQAQFKIDRKALVERHNVKNNAMDTLASLTVGNGRFAYTVDATGLQSFPDYYSGGVPLGTQSEWGWHSFPNKMNAIRDKSLRTYELEGKKISYMVQQKKPDEARESADYFRINPHRLQLANIGLDILKSDGSSAAINDIKQISQELNLWTGVIKSFFVVDGSPVQVTTIAHQQSDAISFKIESDLLTQGRIKLRIRFPYPNGQFKDVGVNWSNEDDHTSIPIEKENAIDFRHILNSDSYWVQLKSNTRLKMSQLKKHYYTLQPSQKQASMEATVLFTPRLSKTPIPGFAEVLKNSQQGWQQYWKAGGAIDFSASTHPKAFELERRTILSQYLIKVQEAGAFPPQETGLTYNSWFGKPHLEMHWWHAAHFAQWGRPQYLENALDWYFTVSNKAFAIAKRQGFEGLRWQKMTDNNGDETPSSVGAFLIWQQPHFIYMSEMLYPAKKNNPVILRKYAKLLFATADFMASFPSYDSITKKYNLGKGLIPAQECFDAVTTFNPTYELAYWSWALQTAQLWRTRLGLKPVAKWDLILKNLAPLPVKEGLYLATESTPDCYTNPRYLDDHPAVLGAYASLPSVHGMDTAIMWNTFQKIRTDWHWNDTWGWDYPVAALCAARLHQPNAAVEALLMPVQKNTYLKNGHNYQDGRLTIYLPGNGGVLAAVAFMCTGGDADKNDHIGFSKKDGWNVKWEGLVKMF